MQGVTVLNSTKVNSDGTYTLPAGVDKSWFSELKSKDKQEEMARKAKNAAIKELNNLFEKNPMAAIEKVKNNDRLFNYVIGALDKFPEGIQNAALGVFIAQESWDKLPKNVATKVLNSPKFATYLSESSVATQALVYGGLIKLSEKGWSVLAPVGYTTKILSQTSEGAKIIAETKVGLEMFKKLKPVSEFIKTHKVTAEGIGYVGDTLSVTAYAYDEYINPQSPAYGDTSKAVYGGINLFVLNTGPIEGVQYGGPVGAGIGAINYFLQGGGVSDIPILNKIKVIKNSDNWHTTFTEKDKRKWLNKQYKNYGKHEASTPDKDYRIGVQPSSGSINFNPETYGKSKQNISGVNPNKAPNESWNLK
ncbi:hypothetical protein [Listeria sp. ILCC792]|nr:hypothetical protein [Listeria sp. ILCC792]